MPHEAVELGRIADFDGTTNHSTKQASLLVAGYPREGGNPVIENAFCLTPLDSRLRGNDGGLK
jgi:hypothetical protein